MEEYFKELAKRAAYYEQFEQIERKWGSTHRIKINRTQDVKHIGNVNVVVG